MVLPFLLGLILLLVQLGQDNIDNFLIDGKFFLELFCKLCVKKVVLV